MGKTFGRGLLGVTLTVGVCASGVAIPQGASAKSTPSESAALVAEGTLEGNDGRKLGKHDVILYAWPSGDAVAQQQVGDTMALTEVGSFKTASDGRFELSVDDVAKLQKQADKNGIVNFEIVASTADGPATFTFPKILKEKDGAFELVESDLDKKGKPKALKPKKLRLKSHGDTIDSDVEYDPESAIIDKGCSQKLVQDLGTQWTVVGSTYSTASGINHDLIYSASAFNEIGVGYSGTGTYGSFKQEGTAGISSTNAVEFPFMSGAGNRQYRTTFRYGKYEFNCSSYGSWEPEHYYKVLPMNHALGNGYVTPPSPPTANYCQPQIGGTSSSPLRVEILNNRSYTWTLGAALKAGIGINLSSRSGYTRESKLRFAFYGNRQLCGNNGDPGVSTLVVGKL
jgi:hypothetical protein